MVGKINKRKIKKMFIRFSPIIAIVVVMAIVAGNILGHLYNKESYAGIIKYSVAVPTELRVNGIKNNYNARIDGITFSWKYNSDDYRNNNQKKYQVVIYKSGDETMEVYNSGVVTSSKNNSVSLENIENTLKPDTLYTWKVKTVGSNGTESDFSEPGVFVTESKTDYYSWSSIWANPVNTETSQSDYVFIKSNNFSIPNAGNVAKVIARVACKGTLTDKMAIGNFYFNGKLYGMAGATSLLKNGVYECYYMAYDITDLITSEYNSVSLTGYSRDNGRGFMVDVTAYYNDGTKEQLINTNDVSNWKAMDADNDVFGYESGNTAQRNTYLSSTGYYSVPMENINTNYYPYGFKEATYDASAWNTAVENLYDSTITDGYYIELKPYQSENVMANEVASKNVFQNSEGDIIFDIGEQTFGILRINFNSNIATDINVYQGYMMDGDNVDYTLNSGIKYNETWTIKEGSNSFDTVINKNFRYLQIETDNLDEATIISIMSSLNNVKAIEMRKEFDDFASSFSSSDGMLNILYEMSKKTYKQTSLDIMTDSVERERIAYEGDVLINSQLDYMFTNDYSYSRESIEYLIENPQWPGDYKCFSVWNTYNYYMNTGDVEFVKKHLDRLIKNLSNDVEYQDLKTGFVRSKSHRNNINGSIVDWPRNVANMPMGFSDAGYYNVPYLCELTYTYKLMAELGNIIGKNNIYTTYIGKYNTLKANLIKYGYNTINGRFYDSLNINGTPYNTHESMHSTAYALACEIYNSDQMAKAMAANVYNDNKDGFVCSIYMSYFVLRGLFNAGDSTDATTLMTMKNSGTSGDASYWAVVNKNANELAPEAWSEAFKANMSHSHPWGAAAGTVISSGIFGIKPLNAGQEFMEVKIQPGIINEASIDVPTLQGDLNISYINEGDRITGTIVVPKNMKVRLLLPHKNSTDEISINGKVVSSIDAAFGFSYVQLSAGTYEFSK